MSYYINVIFSRVYYSICILERWNFCQITQKCLLSGNNELIIVEIYLDIVPRIFILVLLSINVFVAMFTVKLKCIRKSVFNMRIITFARIDIKEKLQ